MIKVLFVCLENICRSPMAQFVFQNLVHEKGLDGEFEIDSAGTEGYNEMCHAGIHPRTKEMLHSMHIPYTENLSDYYQGEIEILSKSGHNFLRNIEVVG